MERLVCVKKAGALSA